MESLRERLTKCFKLTFPKLEDSEVPFASVATRGDWDSVATLNLITLLEEEFGVEVPLSCAEDLSFHAIEAHLVSKYLVGDKPLARFQMAD